MTPEERDLITTLLDRLGSIAGQPKDPEADRPFARPWEGFRTRRITSCRPW
jgi:hypothetical protein